MSNQVNLTKEEKEELELILKFSPRLKIAHELKEELVTVCSNDITPSGGMKNIKKWLTPVRIMFGSAADKLENHLS